MESAFENHAYVLKTENSTIIVQNTSTDESYKIETVPQITAEVCQELDCILNSDGMMWLPNEILNLANGHKAVNMDSFSVTELSEQALEEVSLSEQDKKASSVAVHGELGMNVEQDELEDFMDAFMEQFDENTDVTYEMTPGQMDCGVKLTWISFE